MAAQGITASISPVTSFGIPQASPPSALAELLAGSKWGTAVGAGVALTYSWSAASSAYGYAFDAAHDAGVVALDGAQQQAALAAMQLVSRYANVSFAAAVDSSAQAGDLRWAASSDAAFFSSHGESAFAYYPSSEARGGDIWFDAGLSYFDNVAPGSFGFEDMLHELGHALGLSHPAVQGDGLDQLKFTVMSYRNFAGDAHNYLAQAYPTTYMPGDVAALQFLYGANMSTNAGDTIYSWDPAQPVYETLWDGGGFDTIDARNQRSGVFIDLHAGAWSQIGPAFWNGQYDSAGNADYSKVVRDGLAIANNCTIEAAYGSAFADTLVGNDASNLLVGNGGNDTLSGGGGVDVAAYAGKRSDYTITAQPDGDFIVASLKGGDSDTVRADVERLQFADVSVALDTAGCSGQIWRLYEAAFQRKADAGGVGYFMHQMEQGMTLAQVAGTFVASPEFQQAYGNATDAQFVTRLYENALGREPGAAEASFHVQSLQALSRAQVLVNFSESVENQARHIVDANGAAAELYRLYDTAFDRAPDTAGLVYHVNAMAAGASLLAKAQQFMDSPEFQAKYGSTTDTRFVTLLYENVLGRAPDSAGLAYHLEGLAHGESRALLMATFSESLEHRTEAQFVGVIQDGVAYLPV